ncbi:MAG: hypothetical protein M0R80_08170 [Proteobacteria bacterium]|jgi:hypothetical protein|nr:hypothetical protein [Pseudomonadota bacterium]
MEIGGIDILIPHEIDEKLAVYLTARLIRQHWENAVFENANTEEYYEDYHKLPTRELSEIFVYKDKICKAEWDWDQGNAGPNTMIYVIGQKDLITLVADERDDEMNEIVSGVISVLSKSFNKEQENE